LNRLNSCPSQKINTEEDAFEAYEVLRGNVGGR